MGAKSVLLTLVLLIGMLGCQIAPPADVECTPPAVKMLDVNGNPVCVLPEIEEEPEEGAPEAVEEGIPEEMVPTEEPEEEALPITGEVVAEPAQPVEELPRKVVTEGDLINFPNLEAVDPDGDPISYSFSEPLDASGEWLTEVGDAGEYRVTITASDGKAEVSQDVIIVVLSANQPPSIEPMGVVQVKEGETVSLEPVVSDPDGDQVSVSYSGWMTSSSKTASFTDAGEHIVTVSASDGLNTVSQDVKVIVENLNRQPILAPIADITIDEGDLVVIEPAAADPDNDALTITFTEPLNENGEWQTDIGDAGGYDVSVSVSDGVLTDTRSLTITVKSLNAPPEIQLADQIQVNETETVVLDPVVTDPDGDEVTIRYSGWMTSNTYKTTFTDGGDPPAEYLVTVTATDGTNTVSKDVRVLVADKNRDPYFVGGIN
jgi:hypothetical protein